MKWKELIGKKIVAFRGHKTSRFGTSRVTLSYILFDDNETFLELREQDPYDYHDCCHSARMIDIRQDKAMWKKMFEKDGFEECEAKDSDPFW